MIDRLSRLDFILTSVILLLEVMEAMETVAGEGLLGSLPLAQVDVEDGADQQQRDAHPWQHKTVTKVSFP